MAKVKKTAKTVKKVPKKSMSKKEIMKQLQNPNITKAQQEKLMEQLYKGIDFR